MQFTKATAIAAAAILLQGCDTNKPVPKKETKAAEFLSKVDLNQVQKTLKDTLKAEGEKVRLQPWGNAVINAVAGVIPEHGKVDEYFSQARDMLNSGDKQAKDAFDWFANQVKGELASVDVNHFDEQGHAYATKLLDQVHNSAMDAYNAVDKRSVAQAAEKFEKLVKDNLNVDLHTQKAIGNGMEMISNWVSQGHGMEKEARHYVDDLHLKKDMLSNLGVQAYSSKDIHQVETKVKSHLRDFLKEIQMSLTEANKLANQALDNKAKFVKQAKKVVADADSTLKKTVQDA